MGLLNIWDSGNVVSIQSSENPDLIIHALIEKDRQLVLFARLDKPYLKLRVLQNGQVQWTSGSSKFSMFSPICIHEHKQLFQFKLAANQNKLNQGGEFGWYLGSITQIDNSQSMEEALLGNFSSSPNASFFIKLLTRNVSMKTSCYGSKLRSATSVSQKRSFLSNGYLQIRDVVPIHLVNTALRRINHELGKPGSICGGGVENSVKLMGGISNCKEILDLYYQSSLIEIVEEFLGRGNVQDPDGAQIALRFPQLGEPKTPKGTEWHTDGMRQGKLNPFTVLVGITLSDCKEPMTGNLIVFPESHYRMKELMLPNGKIRGSDVKCFGDGEIWGDGSLPDLGTPHQIIAGRGDIIIAHPLVAHRGGPNYSPDIRYQVYFRIKHKSHTNISINDEDSMKNIFSEFNGLESEI